MTRTAYTIIEETIFGPETIKVRDYDYSCFGKTGTITLPDSNLESLQGKRTVLTALFEAIGRGDIPVSPENVHSGQIINIWYERADMLCDEVPCLVACTGLSVTLPGDDAAPVAFITHNVEGQDVTVYHPATAISHLLAR